MWEKFKQNESLRRTSVLIAICVFLFVIREIISLILLTFILTYLITRMVNVFHRYLKIPKKIIAIFIYGFIVVGIYLAITIYVPKLVIESIAMIESVINFYQKPMNNNSVWEWVASNISFQEIREQLTSSVKMIFDYVTSIGSMGITFVMSFVLSFFFSLEEEWVKSFSQGFLTSKIAWFSQDVAYLGRKFINTFGVVIEAQFIIAIFNTILTALGLYFMGFPQLMALIVMIFIFSLIPVAGVIISSIPLALIGYTVGGIQDVIYVLVMIAVIHLFESYFLNPKLMSSKTDLPVFFVFVILLFSEKFFGVWGLIIGIPVFVFLLDLLEVKSSEKKMPQLSLNQIKKK